MTELREAVTRTGGGDPGLVDRLVDGLRESLASAIGDVFLMSAIVLAVAVVAALFLREVPLRGPLLHAPGDDVAHRRWAHHVAAVRGDVGRPVALRQRALHRPLDRDRLGIEPQRQLEEHRQAETAPMGLAMPRPAMSGAVPWIGSYREGGLYGSAGLRAVPPGWPTAASPSTRTAPPPRR